MVLIKAANRISSYESVSIPCCSRKIYIGKTDCKISTRSKKISGTSVENKSPFPFLSFDKSHIISKSAPFSDLFSCGSRFWFEFWLWIFPNQIKTNFCLFKIHDNKGIINCLWHHFYLFDHLNVSTHLDECIWRFERSDSWSLNCWLCWNAIQLFIKH